MKINDSFKRITRVGHNYFQPEKNFLYIYFYFEYVDIVFKIHDQNLKFQFQIELFQVQNI